MIKRVVSIFIVISVFCVSIGFYGCNKKDDYEKININVATLKGPTGLGILKVLDDNQENKTANKYNISVFGNPSDVASRLINGEIDVATLPTNMAAMIYNKTNGGIQIAAVNTLGVIYVLSSNDSLKSIADLKGKKIFISGKGATPEYALKYILNKNGLVSDKDFTIEYKSEHEELASLAVAGKVDTILLPEPFVTQVINKNQSFKIKLDLTYEWSKASLDESLLTMGCMVVRKKFAKENKEQFDSFLSEYAQSVEFVNANVENAANLSQEYGIMQKDVAMSAIPKCNIVFISGEEMKTKVNNFFSVLFDFEPKSIGGKIPSEEFYY